MTQLLSPIVLFIAVSHLLLPTNSKATTLKEDVAVAQQSLFSCQKKQVQAIDDKKSDARVIALNLTELCLDEYETLNRIMARSNYDTTNERRMFT